MMHSFDFKQIHPFPAEDVFPLLCPVREIDWLDGWDYHMIHSNSGLIEEGCVFTTTHLDKEKTVWTVTKHNKQVFKVSFVRVTPNKNVVMIDISVEPVSDQQSKTHITYPYIHINSADNINSIGLEKDFITNMKWWEESINYYLENGVMLKRRE